MATFRMKYVKAYEDRHGKMRYYYRRPGFPSIALPGEPGGKEFAEAYEVAKQNAPRKIGEDRVAPGSFSALIAEYYESTGYKILQPITKRTYRNVLERFRKDFGGMPVRLLTPARLDELLDSLAHKPGAQGTLRKVLRLILNLAVRRRLIVASPMVGVRLSRKPKVGFRAWTEAHIAAYRAHWPTGSRERLALELLLCTVQRRTDVVAMGRQHTKPGKIHVAQAKSKGQTRLWIPIVPELQAELDQVPATQLTFLQTQYGQPFTAAGFGNWFRECALAAGLPEGFTAHGLRKAGSRRLAEAGCTPNQIMAITGHANLSEVTLYTASADQERLAEEAIERTKASNPGGPVRQSGR